MPTATASGYLYFGPDSTKYERDVSISEQVNVLWKEGSWYYVETTKSTPKRRNYIASVSNITGGTPPTFTPSLLTRYTMSTTPATEKTYTGPATSYAQAGSLGPNETVKYLDTQKVGDYALIEYDITGKTTKKRAWFPHMKLTTTPPVIEKGIRPVGASFKSNDYPNYPSGNFHGGTDIGSTEGASYQDPVKASFAGKVVSLKKDVSPGTGTNYGNYVTIESTINGITYRTWYAHLDSVESVVVQGGNITKGQTIGKLGNTGNCIPQTYKHLHLEYRKGPNYIQSSDTVDPKSFY